MGRRLLALAFVALGGCHLADDKDAPKCEQGSRPENDRCVENEVAAYVARIHTDCTVAPEPFTVKVSTDFQFKNESEERRTVSGLAGKLSLDLAPGEVSSFVQIAKTGSYPYAISGCPTGGTIAVE